MTANFTGACSQYCLSASSHSFISFVYFIVWTCACVCICTCFYTFAYMQQLMMGKYPKCPISFLSPQGYHLPFPYHCTLPFVSGKVWFCNLSPNLWSYQRSLDELTVVTTLVINLEVETKSAASQLSPSQLLYFLMQTDNTAATWKCPGKTGSGLDWHWT